MTAQLAYDRRGSGAPLVLLHGSGSDRRVWRLVVERLVAEREVIAVDLPGHGDSAPLRDRPPTAAGFAAVLVDWLDEHGLGDAHLGGNSMGGWTALEVAKRGRGASVTAICPAGLWAKHSPRLSHASLWLSRRVARGLAPRARGATRSKLMRSVLFAQVTPRPWRVPAHDAAAAIVAMGTAPGYDEHLEATARERFDGGDEISVPLMVVWGRSDRLLPPRVRSVERLPPPTGVLRRPGWGHVPMWEDPDGVAEVLLEGSSPRR